MEAISIQRNLHNVFYVFSQYYCPLSSKCKFLPNYFPNSSKVVVIAKVITSRPMYYSYTLPFSNSDKSINNELE